MKPIIIPNQYVTIFIIPNQRVTIFIIPNQRVTIFIIPNQRVTIFITYCFYRYLLFYYIRRHLINFSFIVKKHVGGGGGGGGGCHVIHLENTVGYYASSSYQAGRTVRP